MSVFTFLQNVIFSVRTKEMSVRSLILITQEVQSIRYRNNESLNHTTPHGISQSQSNVHIIASHRITLIVDRQLFFQSCVCVCVGGGGGGGGGGVGLGV